jgi:hypothetical protein
MLATQLGRCDRYDEARAMWRELIGEAYECADPDVGGHLFFLAELERPPVGGMRPRDSATSRWKLRAKPVTRCSSRSVG